MSTPLSTPLVLLPLIFAIVIDCIMSRTAGRNTFGLLWIEGDKPKDLDFADITLLEWEGIKHLTKRVQIRAVIV